MLCRDECAVSIRTEAPLRDPSLIIFLNIDDLLNERVVVEVRFADQVSSNKHVM